MAGSDPKHAANKSQSAPPTHDLAETNVPGSADELAETNVPARSAADNLGATGIGKDPASSKSAAAQPKPKPQQAKTTAAGGKKKVTQLGDFKILKKLGKGGMGEVYLATQVSLDRKVALKTLSKELAKKQNFVQRFIREARSMAKIHHPNVVQVYAADSFKGVHFAAIEFIDGKSMQDWMDELGKLSIGDALYVVLQCADALRHAHELNMIHRDIKPDNILVTRKGEVKVADFGLAKALDEDVSMTQSGTGLGTPLYMSPEQARNAKHVDHRTDIYALGCMLYHFVTGELPFKGDNTLELIMAKEEGRFTSARRLNPDIPERLDLMIDKMMAKSPQHRYADCSEIIRDLQGLELDSPSLSFIDAGEVVAARRTLAAARSGPATSLPKPSGKPVTSAEDAARTEAKTSKVDTGKMWIVQHTNPAGKMVIAKMSTVQIQQGIRTEVLDLKAKAKVSAKDKLLPLAQYAEFSSLIEKRAIRAKAESKAGGLKEQFEMLDRQDRRRKRWRWLKNLTANVKGLIGLILWLALIFGGGWAAVVYGIPWIKSMFSG